MGGGYIFWERREFIIILSGGWAALCLIKWLLTHVTERLQRFKRLHHVTAELPTRGFASVKGCKVRRPSGSRIPTVSTVLQSRFIHDPTCNRFTPFGC